MNMFEMVWVYLTPDRDVYITNEPNDNDQILVHGTYSEIFSFADSVLMDCDEPLAELVIERLDDYFGSSC